MKIEDTDKRLRGEENMNEELIIEVKIYKETEKDMTIQYYRKHTKV